MGNLVFFNVSLFNLEGFVTLVIRFGINILFVSILILKIYLRINRNREYLVIFFVFNVLIFFVASLLSNVKLETGFAFGLFAVFSIIRYRTRQIPIKEMTFLFSAIIIATINSTVTKMLSYAEILLANAAILGIIMIMDKDWTRFVKEKKDITYEKIELIVPEKRGELIADLEKRTGLKIIGLRIRSVNFLRDTARIRIYYLRPPRSYEESGDQ